MVIQMKQKNLIYLKVMYFSLGLPSLIPCFYAIPLLVKMESPTTNALLIILLQNFGVNHKIKKSFKC